MKKSDIYDRYNELYNLLSTGTEKERELAGLDFVFQNEEIDEYLNTAKGTEVNSSILKEYVSLKKEIEKKSFNEIAAVIKEKKGEVAQYVKERAVLECYYNQCQIIIRNCARKKGVYFIDNHDIESIKTSVFTALTNFDISKPPHDINRFVNVVVENKVVDLIKERIRRKKIAVMEMEKGREEYQMNVSDEESLINNSFDSELKKVFTVKEGEVIENMLSFYKGISMRENEFKISLSAMTIISRECRSLFIEIMRLSLMDIEYSTRGLMEAVGIEKSEDAMRQTLRMCRKRLAREIGILRGVKNEKEI